MYHIMSLLTGMLTSVMILFNGKLGGQYGVHSATVFIHITGLALIGAVVLIKRERPFAKRHGWYFYLGGAIGVMTVAFTNLAFGRISVSAILALGLLGQSVIGLIIDQTGWLGLPKHPFQKQNIIGLLLILGGIAVMIDNFEIAAVVLSFICGVNVVLSRTLNAKLAEYSSVRTSTFFNYLIGGGAAIPVFLLFGRQEAVFGGLTAPADVSMFFGGAAGVCVIFLTNILVAKIPAYYLSLLCFVGQIFAGILIDAVIARSFSPENMLGGSLVAAGLCCDLLIGSLYRKGRRRP